MSHDTHQTTRAGRREWIGLAVLALPAMVVTMDLTVLFLAVPKMTAALDPSATQLLWISDAYGFLIAGSLMVMGTLGDRIGRRRVLLTGAAAFGLASLLAAGSSSAEMLIAARALQGIAGATLVPSAMALIFSMFRDETQRTVALGVMMSAFAGGAAVGPLAGGTMLEFFDWNSVFLPNLPVMALLLVLGPKLLPEFRNPESGRVDLTSAALSIAGVLATVYGIKHAAQHGLSAQSVASIAAGIAIGAAFVARQGRLAQPMIDLRLFRVRAFSTALAANVLGAFVMYGIFFFTSQYLQLVIGLSPLEAGLWSLPPLGALMVTSMLVPKIAARIRPGYIVAAGMAVTAAGFALLTQLDAESGLALLVPALVIAHIGIAPGATLGTNLIVGAAPPEQAGSASGVAETANELGGAFGIALLGSVGSAIYRSQVGDAIPDHVTPAAAHAAHDTLGGAVSVAGQLPPDVLDAAVSAFGHGLQLVAIVSAVLMLGMAVISAVMLRHVPAPTRSEAGQGADAHAALPALVPEAAAA